MESFIASARQLVYDISMSAIIDSINDVGNLQDWGEEYGNGAGGTTDERYGIVVPHVRG